MSDHEMNVASGPHSARATPGPIAQKLGEQTRKVVSDVQHKAGEQVRTGIDSGMQRAAGALKGVAESMTGGSTTDDAGAGQYVRQAGEQVRRAADYLENTDVKKLARDTESFARRQPAAFLGGAFVLGVVAARFFKNSQRTGDEKPALTAGDSRSADLFPVIAQEGALGSDREPERGGWYEHEQPKNSYREPMPPSLGEQL